MRGLQEEGFRCEALDTGARLLARVSEVRPDLLILDIGLPERDGFRVLQTLRARGSSLPVIVLTGRSDRDVVTFLEAGADDYLQKPFRFDELTARVRRRLHAAGRTTAGDDILRAGDIRLDLRTRRATIGDRTVDLTGREFALLETLLRHADQVLSREQLLSQVWGYYFEPGTNVVNVYVNSLRRKLGPDVIESVRGVGYRLPARTRERKEVFT
jgi:DNA-binding response OmpR family regulator